MDWKEAAKSLELYLLDYRDEQKARIWPDKCQVCGSCHVGTDWIFFMRGQEPLRLFIAVISANEKVALTMYEGALEGEETGQQAWQDLTRRFARGRDMDVDEADMPAFVNSEETWNPEVARYLRADLQYGRFGTVPPWEDPIYRGAKLGPRGHRKSRFGY